MRYLDRVGLDQDLAGGDECSGVGSYGFNCVGNRTTGFYNVEAKTTCKLNRVSATDLSRALNDGRGLREQPSLMQPARVRAAWLSPERYDSAAGLGNCGWFTQSLGAMSSDVRE